MYSSEIIERRLAKAKKLGMTYKRLPRDTCIEVTNRLKLLQFNSKGERLPEGELIHPLDEKEQEFIRSERLLCKCDFSYYLTRYHSIERDEGVGSEGGIGPARTIESQDAFIKYLGHREDQVHAEYSKHGFTEGIKVYAHKCRQVSFTTTAGAAKIHRMLFYPGTRAFCCALNPDGTGELYKRDKIAVDNLPFFFHPEIYPDVKDTELGFSSPINSRLLYQSENQKSGIGVGTQMDVSHLTEVSLWTFPYQIAYSFCPAIPKSRSTLHIQEATSMGADNYWQEVTEACRRRENGYESWTYIFVPWYMNHAKFVAIPPDGWKPLPHTIAHAELIERTSPEWCWGSTVRASTTQLYWWETERARHMKEDKLAYFLANYPATPEQSFSNFSEGALPADFIERLELGYRQPLAYEVNIG